LTFNVGDIITLKGKSLKGKNRVREQGDQWIVNKADRPLVNNSTLLLIRPIVDKDNDHDPRLRWVFPANDKDFEIKLTEE
jgi:hypothetical protein